MGLADELAQGSNAAGCADSASDTSRHTSSGLSYASEIENDNVPFRAFSNFSFWAFFVS